MTTIETPRTAAVPPDNRMQRLAGWAQRHRWTAVLLWVVAMVGITAGSMAVGDAYEMDNSIPGSQSQKLVAAMERHQPEADGDTIMIVLYDEGGLDADQAAIKALVDDVAALPHVASVTAPDPRGGTLSPDGTTGIADVVLDEVATKVDISDIKAIIDTAKDHEKGGFEVDLTGDSVREVQESDAGGGGEGVGMLAALVILLFMFGSLLAASLPLITAIFAVGTTLSLVILASHFVKIPDYTAPVLILVGLGVGIDYALLVFSRFRSELLAGADRDQATRTALDTAGRSVLFAGATVIIALLGLYVLGLGAIQGIAVGVTMTVLLTMVASLTLLPALLSLFGNRIEKVVRKHAAKKSRPSGHGWRVWAGWVQRYPWPALVVSVAALGALAVPAFGMQLGFADAGTDHPSTSSRQAYDRVSEAFGPGANGPLFVVTEGTETQAQAAYTKLDGFEGIAEVTPPQPSEDGEMYTSLAFPTTSPQDTETAELVKSVRSELGDEHLVGGATAAAIDFSDAVDRKFPLFVAVVVGMSALLLMIVFRSIPVAIKAACLNLLSIGAALGVMKLVFQDGRFGAQEGPIEAFVPVMTFAIVFGLSMDYEVFLMSRMHEEWTRTKDATRAVREGLATTGAVITAAGAIMIVVFGAFLLAPDRFLQQFGLGLSVAVLLDAVLIRCLVAPAIMRILGERAWWLPGWLDKILPHVAIERPELEKAAETKPAGV
ncbi:MMPL family transporter [Nocardioides speluncae]|uniref:MMPL family transporter n=1 Tax=Nocardioides speluncae TaxID=2670337 RepID=UPI000D685D76|nr:MMPL family transporter [Nocardioides speluncae]